MVIKSDERGGLTDTTTTTITFGMLLIQMMTMMNYQIGLKTMMEIHKLGNLNTTMMDLKTTLTRTMTAMAVLEILENA